MTFFERLESLRKALGISQKKLENDLGLSNGSVSKWKKSMPKAETILMLANYFHVSQDYLLTGEEKTEPEYPYYLNDDAKDMAEFIFKNPEYKVLFDASRKVSKEDIATVMTIMDKFKKD